jgi:hypothetical protein
MMNKIITLFLIQSIVLSGFLAVANDTKVRTEAPQPRINGDINSTTLGLAGKSQMFKVTGCPTGSTPIWSYKKAYHSGNQTPEVTTNLGLVPGTTDSYFTVTMGNTNPNVSPGDNENWYEYTVQCSDTLDPTLAIGQKASIKTYIQSILPGIGNTYPRGFADQSKLIEVKSCGNGPNNQGALTHLKYQGCPEGSFTYFKRPSENNQTFDDGTTKYWEKLDTGGDLPLQNNYAQGTYSAHCKAQYYDPLSKEIKYEFTFGVHYDVKKYTAAPKLDVHTSAYIKDINGKPLNPEIAQVFNLCHGERVNMNSRLFDDGRYDLSQYEYHWYDNNKGKVASTEKSFNVTEEGFYYVKLKHKDPLAQICNVDYDKDGAAFTINYKILKKPTISGENQVCPGGNNTAKVSNVNQLSSPTSYVWYVNDQAVSGQTLPSFQFGDNISNIKVSYISTIKGELGNFCSAPKSDALVISAFDRPAQPVITKKSGEKGYCDYQFPVSGVELESSNTITNGSPKYTWYLGSTETGTDSKNLNPTIEGVYSVIITDGNGCKSLASDNYVIQKYISPAKPSITNTNGEKAYCDYKIPFATVTLKAENTSLVGAATYTWSTGSSLQTSDVKEDGIYTVMITDEHGCSSEEGSYEIVKNKRPDKPTITNSNGKSAFCDYDVPFAAVTLSASNTSIVGDPSYLWNTGSKIQTTLVTKEGNYSVTVTDQNNCESLPGEYSIVKYTSPAQPVVTKKTGANAYCDYKFPVSDLVLESSNTALIGNPIYTWSTKESTSSIAPINEGFYSVKVTDGNGCTSIESAKYEIVKWTRPVQPVVTRKSGADAYCDYKFPVSDLVLESSNTALIGNPVYNWSTKESTSTIAPGIEGFYSVNVTDGNGCTSIESAKFEIVKWTRPAQPVVTRKSGADAYCDYKFPVSDLVLESSNTAKVGNPIYNWSTKESTSSIAPIIEGFYSVNLTDGNGCASIESAKYEIVKWTRPAKPVITRKTGADAYCDYKFPVTDLTLESSNTALVGNAIYTWNKEIKTKVIPVTTEGTYTVIVTDGNACESVSSDAYTITKWTSPVSPSIAITGNKVNCALDDSDKAVTVAFSVSNHSDKFTYEWFNTGSNTVLSKTNVLNSVASNGTYYSIQTDKNGCYSPKSEGIKASFVQNPNFSGSRISKSTAYGLKADGFADNWTQSGITGVAGDYQWKSGATINPNTIDNIKVSTANNGNGDYSVRRKYAFNVDNTPIVCFSNTVKYTFVADPDFKGVAIYPNPTSGKVYIDLLDEWKNASVTVYDMVGRPVYTGTLNSANATGVPIDFDLGSLGSGIYIIHIKSSTGDRSYQGKILVNR